MISYFLLSDKYYWIYASLTNTSVKKVKQEIVFHQLNPSVRFFNSENHEKMSILFYDSYFSYNIDNFSHKILTFISKFAFFIN